MFTEYLCVPALDQAQRLKDEWKEKNEAEKGIGSPQGIEICNLKKNSDTEQRAKGDRKLENNYADI